MAVRPSSVLRRHPRPRRFDPAAFAWPPLRTHRPAIGGRAVQLSPALPRPLRRADLWRPLLGVALAGGPATVLLAASPGPTVLQAGVLCLVAVAAVTFLTDWVGGLAALAVAVLTLATLAARRGEGAGSPGDLLDAAVALVGAAVVLGLVQGVKYQSRGDRLDAAAARAATNAVIALEQAAAGRVPGDPADRDQFLDALLAAMVRVTRAHAGALFLAEEDGAGAGAGLVLERAAAYGLDQLPDDHPSSVRPGEGLLGEVIVQRRPLWARDIRGDRRLAGGHLHAAGVRALLAVPLVTGDDRLVGVAHVDLLVPHRFSRTEVARLEAIAGRGAALLETGRLAERRQRQLSRARADLRRLEGVVAAMPEAVVLALPPDGRIAVRNAAAERLFGLHAGDRSPLDCLRRPDGGEAAPDELPLARALLTGEVIGGVELLVARDGAPPVPVLASAAPLWEADGADGSVGAVVAVFQDIGPLKEATRLQEEFVSVVSHELRSPLTPIRGFVQLVAKDLERAGGHDVQVGRLRSLTTQVDRLTRLVDDLLDVSRLRVGHLEIAPCRTDLVGLCRDLIEGRRPAAADHELVLASDAPDAVGAWDPDRIHQVVDNLVGNAIKYSPGGVVRVSVAVEGAGDARAAVLRVDDDGPGLPPDQWRAVFDAFYRTEDASASRAAGVGLGLYICRELVRAHGGTIEAGAAPGGGARFTVRLPLAVADHHAGVAAD